mmetsp:Transcript_22788/g.28719  ORF Transcript_22788/g.28719 Transcript_22788/m.28719 type:complete len:227 (+) Transcript_22788:158-838(+)
MKREVALLLISFIVLITLLNVFQSSSTISTSFHSFSVDNSESSSIGILEPPVSSESLPIYLIDMSNISQPNIAVSTWGNIAPHWNRTTQYSNLLNLATTVPSSLPNQQYNNTINNKKRRQIILIHCGPKLGSSTLRKACEENMEQTCPQINFTAYINHAEVEEKGPAGYFGGDRMLSLMNECVDTHYFCVRDIEVMHMLPPSTTTTTTTTDGLPSESHWMKSKRFC